MGYRQLFSEYVSGTLPFSAASARVRREGQTFTGNGQELEKARICSSYFDHYDQYNHGYISCSDFLMFLRDFILYLGRTPMPQSVELLVRENGSKFGLSVSADGCIDAAYHIPEWLEQKEFVHEAYSLSFSGQKDTSVIFGDRIIADNSSFQTYRTVEQKIAVHAAIDLPDDHTLMVSLPTGGGKSLITQMLAATSKGLTIVIVPTVALASDQFIQAQQCITSPGFSEHTFCYRSDTPPLALKKTLSELYSGTARLLITSPEAIMKNTALNNAIHHSAEQRYLHNVVIDEAHIVPDWGLLFRPDFQIFSVFLKELRPLSGHTIRTYLLSATLSEDVVETLFELFGQEGKNIQYRCDALRSEPRFLYSECHDFLERRNRVVQLVQCLPKPLIVYVLEPREAEFYKRSLYERGFYNIQTFTGETKDKRREELLIKWKENQIDVMIATSAFGMGVDKANVRTVIHACVPENISRFYQEVGRAGRDGLPSLSVLIPYVGKTDKQSDLGVAFGLISKSILSVDKLIIRWFSMIRAEKTVIIGQEAMVDLNTAPSTFSEEDAAHTGVQNMIWNVNALLLLHRQRYICIKTAQYIPGQNTYYFTFQMLDIDLLWDEEKLRAALIPDRSKEQNARLDSYRQMADLVHHPRSKCWAKRLVKIFPLAEELCNGCAVHSVKPYNYDAEIKIREAFPIGFESVAPVSALKRYLGSYRDLLIPTSEYRSIDQNQLVICANRLELSCIVLPNTDGVAAISNGMVLTADQFITIAPKAPWLFKGGVMILFDDDITRSNKLFDVSHRGDFMRINKVLLCKEDMMIYSQMRPLNEFLDCNQTTLERLQKE